MVERITDILPEVVGRVQIEQEANHSQPSSEELAEMRQRRDDEIQQRLGRLLSRVGPRYRDATLDNYRSETREQQSALDQLRSYAANLHNEVKVGRGILLFGSTGTGKDHLLIGLAKIAVSRGCELTWVNGVDLHAKMRDAIQRDASEASVLDLYDKVRVLVLSDPLPPSGVLSDFQAATLYRLTDHRYRNLLPIWCSLNVTNADEARARLGAATVDRLRDGALAIECKWPSFRKSRCR